MGYSGEQLSIIALNLAPEIGPMRFSALVDYFGSAEEAVKAPPAAIAEVLSIPVNLGAKIKASADLGLAEKEAEDSSKLGIRIVTKSDRAYPDGLRLINDQPPVLYVKGDISALESPSIAVVGTRLATSYGRAAASSFAAEFAGMGLTVVSGLARGIDTEAHEASLKNGGKTVAVLGNGLGHCYPPENRKLQEKIIRKGAVVSEFPVDRRPDKINFPRRNRIISALSSATVVIEADIKSGALITAKYAAEQGKEVFAVPGQIYSKYSAGTNYLIKSGAHLADSPTEIIESIPEFHGKLRKHAEKAPAGIAAAGEGQQRILWLLESASEGVSVDFLAANLKMEAGALSRDLLALELKGAVRSLPGRIYILQR